MVAATVVAAAASKPAPSKCFVFIVPLGNSSVTLTK
jgi:hypothetical protein